MKLLNPQIFLWQIVYLLFLNFLVIFDVYLSPKYKVFLVDIQPLHEHSGTLMFSFSEIKSASNELNETPIFKFVKDRQKIMLSSANLWRMPFDVLHQEQCFPDAQTGTVFDLIKKEYEKQMKEDE